MDFEDFPIERGFSEDDDSEDGLSHCSNQHSTNGSLDLLTTFLKESPSTSRQKSPKCEEVETGQVAILARMKQMEKELAELRKQVKKEDSKPPKQVQHRSNILPSRKYNGHKHPFAHEDEVTKGPKNRNLASKIISQRCEDKQAGIVTEKYSGLRLKNPKISSEEMKRRMQDYKMIRIKSVSTKAKTAENWVTIGVVVDKLPPRDTIKGKRFAIWKLSDLSGQSAVITLFLFGGAFQDHWKTSLGTIVAIRNPSVMPDRENGTQSRHSNIAFSIDAAKCLLVMGDSQDYTVCKGVTKGGKRCSNFASLADGGYCDYHVRRAYDASRSQRMECQKGYGPSTSKGTLKDKLFQRSKTDIYYYGGQTFTAPSKSCVSAGTGVRKSSQLFAPGSSEIFAKMLQGQSAGAKMLTQHQKMKEEMKATVGAKVAHKTPSELLPLLGRGAKPGDHVDLFSPPKNSQSLAKQRAIRVVQNKGAPDKAEKISKRVRESRGEIDGDQEESEDDKTIRPMELKKPRLDHAEVDALINAKSSHDWINQEAELVRDEEYFNRLEKKEAIETKKNSVTELRVSVVHCKKCQYTAEFPSKLCTKENHTLTRWKALKRGFTCRECSQKTFTYDCRRPVKACAKCGGTDYESASIYTERKGPTLPTEQLLLRGIEEKFMK